MGPAYLGCSLVLWIMRRRPYRDNPFEHRHSSKEAGSEERHSFSSSSLSRGDSCLPGRTLGLVLVQSLSARRAMEICHRQFVVMNVRTLRTMALIDWVAGHWWLAMAYFVLVVAAVAFLQIRGRPAWTYWLTAALFCIPCVAYWFPCAAIAGKLFLRP